MKPKNKMKNTTYFNRVDILTSSPESSTKTVATINDNDNNNNQSYNRIKATLKWTPYNLGYQFFCFSALTKKR